MSITVTTSSHRKLLRRAPLAVLLAGAVATGMTVSPRPFRYDSWPKPPAAAPAQTLVEVRPEAAASDQATVVPHTVRRVAALPSGTAASWRPTSHRTAPRRVAHIGARRATTGSTTGSNRAHGRRPTPNPGATTPPSGQSGDPQRQQPAPAPSQDPAPTVQVAQAAPSTTPQPRAEDRQGLVAAAATVLHAEPPGCGHGGRVDRPHGPRGGLGADESDGD